MKAAKLNDKSKKRHLLKENNGILKFCEKCENIVLVFGEKELKSFAKIFDGNAVKVFAN